MRGSPEQRLPHSHAAPRRLSPPPRPVSHLVPVLCASLPSRSAEPALSTTLCQFSAHFRCRRFLGPLRERRKCRVAFQSRPKCLSHLLWSARFVFLAPYGAQGSVWACKMKSLPSRKSPKNASTKPGETGFGTHSTILVPSRPDHPAIFFSLSPSLTKRRIHGEHTRSFGQSCQDKNKECSTRCPPSGGTQSVGHTTLMFALRLCGRK